MNEEILKLAKECGWFITEPKYPYKIIPTTDAAHITAFYKAAFNAGIAAAAESTGKFAKAWWSAHCASNKHMETTRKAHDDFCLLQIEIKEKEMK